MCAWEGCARTDILARGLCNRCYRRARRTGALASFTEASAACRTCGADFIAGKSGAKFCSNECRAVDYTARLEARKERRAAAKVGRACEGCGRSVPLGARADARFCSTDCQQAAWYASGADRLRARARAWAQANPDLRNHYEHKRRARKLGGDAGDERIVRRLLPNVCGICSGAIDEALRFPDPLSKSVDHIVPLARGGAHSIENVQAAHLRCNLSKGASA